MEKKDDLIGILTRFEVVTKQIFLIVTQQSTTEVKRVYLHCIIVLRQHTQRREGVCEISLFCGEELYSPVLYRCSVQLFSRKSWKQRTCSHRQYVHTAQKQRTRVFFYNLQYIRRIFKVSYIIECIRDYYRAEISGSYCGNYDCKILKYLFVFFLCYIFL